MGVNVDPARLALIHAREVSVFSDRRPRSAALSARAAAVMPDAVPMAWMAALHRHPIQYLAGGEGSRFEDIDANKLIDFNLADLSNAVGYGDNPVAKAVTAQAQRGLSFFCRPKTRSSFRNCFQSVQTFPFGNTPSVPRPRTLKSSG